MLYYTGVGSRDTPEGVCRKMRSVARRLAERGLTLRSGHADGADLAFEVGAIKGGGQCEIFLPWAEFNGAGRGPRFIIPRGELATQAMEVASQVHPKWSHCDRESRLLHSRNVFQVFGKNLDAPSKFLICWTEDGADVGGTRTAIVLARTVGIPILNLGRSTKLFGRAPCNMDVDEIVLWALRHGED